MSTATRGARRQAIAPRRRYSLTSRADLAVFYAADTLLYRQNGKQYLLNLLPLPKFTAFYAGCASIGFACDGQAIGGMIFDGEQVHIAVLAEHHGRWTFLLKPALDWLFSLKPEVPAQLDADNALAIRFMERNGWKRLDDPAAQAAGKATYLVTQQKTRRWPGGR